MPKNSKKKSNSFTQFLRTKAKQFKAWRKNFLDRRPHRSFQRTKRRDAVRPLALGGYWSFTHHVNKTVWRFRKLLIGVTAVYAALTVIFIGIGSQDVYQSIVDLLRDSNEIILQGELGQIGQSFLLFSTLATSGLTGAMTDAQQLYTGLLLVLVWLTTVWLLRQKLAGHTVKLRDGLYNAGAPLIPTVLIGFVVLLQLLPIGVAMLAYSAASGSGLIDGGVEAMLFWVAAGFLSILSMYWLVGSFFAMVVVTLPGTYPLKALFMGGDIVLGRRVPILLRVLWMLLATVVVWALLLIPMILLDSWIKSLIPAIDWLPIIPVVLLLMGSATVVWSATYIYLLYRKVVEHDAQTA